MSLLLPDAAKFARMAGPAPFGKRTRRAETSISEITEAQAEEVRQRLGLPNLGCLYHLAIVHFVAPKESRAVTVNPPSTKGKKVNPLNSSKE